VNSAGFSSSYEIETEKGTVELIYDVSGEETRDWFGLAYHFRSDNARCVDYIYDEAGNEYEVWYWEFRMEPGTYEFANGYSPYLSELNSSFTDYGYGEYTAVEDGDHVVLYSSFGDAKFRADDNTLKLLIDYAKKKDAELNEGNPSYTAAAEGETTVIEETVDTPVIEEAEVEEEAEPSVTLVPTEEENTENAETEAEAAEEPAKKSKAGIYIFVVIAALAAGILVSVKIKKDKN
jgi:hypothetical protein